MPIKDKDGKVYQLRGPNPLMKTQQEWDRNALQLYNLKKSSEVIVDERNPVEKQKENVIDIGQELQLGRHEEIVDVTRTVKAKDFIEEIQEPVIEPVVVVVKEEPKEDGPVVIETDARLARLIRERGVEYHCAPAIGEVLHKDELYGSSYTTTRYGTNFIFDAIVLDHSDFQLQFWSVREIAKNSIVYRRHPEGGERWWRITSTEPKTGGFISLAGISDLNPDFS